MMILNIQIATVSNPGPTINNTKLNHNHGRIGRVSGQNRRNTSRTRTRGAAPTNPSPTSSGAPNNARNRSFSMGHISGSRDMVRSGHTEGGPPPCSRTSARHTPARSPPAAAPAEAAATPEAAATAEPTVVAMPLGPPPVVVAGRRASLEHVLNHDSLPLVLGLDFRPHGRDPRYARTPHCQEKMLTIQADLSSGRSRESQGLPG